MRHQTLRHREVFGSVDEGSVSGRVGAHPFAILIHVEHFIPRFLILLVRTRTIEHEGSSKGRVRREPVRHRGNLGAAEVLQPKLACIVDGEPGQFIVRGVCRQAYCLGDADKAHL